MYDKRMRWQLQNKSGMSEAYDCKCDMRGRNMRGKYCTGGVKCAGICCRYSVLGIYYFSLTDKNRSPGCVLLESLKWHRIIRVI